METSRGAVARIRGLAVFNVRFVALLPPRARAAASPRNLNSSKALQKRVVRRELLQPFEQHLHRGHRIGSCECPPERVNLRQDRRGEELFLFARSGLCDVDRGEDAALEEAAIE